MNTPVKSPTAATQDSPQSPPDTVASKRATKKRSAKKRHGVNPWVPNQHGAWAMLILPVVVGFITGIVTSPDLTDPLRWLLWISIMTAWIIGYFTFFAFGLWFKTKAAKRKQEYAKPLKVYGSITAIAAVITFTIMPSLLYWGIPFVPLVAIALLEIYRRDPRSLASGISTTLASSLLYPVMVSAGGIEPLPQFFTSAPADVWVSTLMIALYFTGTIFYVKSIIREKGNANFLRISVAYHWIALAIALAACAWVLPQGDFDWAPALGLVVMTLCVARATNVPLKAAIAPKKWTPKFAGMMEMPYVLLLALGCGLTLVA